MYKLNNQYYRCLLGLLRNSSTASGSTEPGGTVGTSYSLAVGTYFFSIYSLLSSYSLCLFYLISFLLFPLRDCQGKHSCMSFQFPVAILNGTFFRETTRSKQSKCRLSKTNHNNKIATVQLPTSDSFNKQTGKNEDRTSG